MAANNQDNSCCRLEGRLFTGVQLERIFEGKGDLQSDQDYLVPAGLNLKEEVARAYHIASASYSQFKRAMDNPSYTPEVKLEATRNFARSLFNAALAYNLPLNVDNIQIEEGREPSRHVLTFPITMLLDQEDTIQDKAEHNSGATTNIKPLTGAEGQRVSAIIPLTVVYAGLDPKTKKRSTLDTVMDACSISDSAQPKKVGRRSPFALTQELLNASSDYLWGMAFNGYSLRLLRDVMSFSRPSYVEFDLEAIFEGDNQAEFSHLYLLLHSSRTHVDSLTGLNVWEHWLNLCVEEGIPAREQLGQSMQEALVCLGTGFLRAKGAGNDALRAKLANHELSAQDYNHQLLRLMYRFLFIFCLEERGIIHTRPTKESIAQKLATLQAHALQDKFAAERQERTLDESERTPDEPEQSFLDLNWGQVEVPELKDVEPITRQRVLRDYHRACALYDQAYALHRLRDMALKQRLFTNYQDLWASIKVVLKALSQGEEILALPALGGLFTADQCPDLMAPDVNLTNADLLQAMKLMRWATLQGVVTVIDYRNMNTEELGSLYEGLLELVPKVQWGDAHNRTSFRFGYAQANANERKSSGSYYTPDSLVQSLIKTALDPVIEQKLKDNPNDPETALLSLKVIDPACGSGHFLLAAARRIAEVIMKQKAFMGAPAPVEYRKTLHDVISHCIYGVDLNPMAVELARMALWLEGVAENKPLSFIDHHLKVGNSLLGVMDLDVLKLGIPAAAYTEQKPIGKGEYALTLSDKTVCSTLKKRNTKERKVFDQNILDTGLGDLGSVGNSLAHLGYKNIDELTADTITAEERKATQNARNQKAIEESVGFKACNLLLAAFLSKKTQATEHLVPTTKDLDLLMTDPEGYANSHQDILDHANKVCAENHVLHWPFAFMEVMDQGGFDCVLGNPPWEKPQLEDKQWFAQVCPEIANASTGALREKMIGLLAQGELTSSYSVTFGVDRLDEDQKSFEHNLFVKYVKDNYQSWVPTTFQHLAQDDGGRFKLTGFGRVNLFAHFAELALDIKNQSGTVGMVLPAGILIDDSTKRFSQEVFSNNLVKSAYHFNNTSGIFPDVHSSYSFILLTLGYNDQSDCVFYATLPKHLDEVNRHVSFEHGDIALINPNTKTALLVRSEYDLELCRKLYRKVPILIKENDAGQELANPWRIQTASLFHMTNDSGLFTSFDLSHVSLAQEQNYVPLYEGKLFTQFDHRFASFDYNKQGVLVDAQNVVLSNKQKPSFRVLPRFWVKASEVQARWSQKSWDAPWAIVWRDIARATDERTVIASVIPAQYGVGNTAAVLMPHADAKLASCLLAMLNSLIVDYVERIKQSSAHVNRFYLKQLPILPPEAFKPEDVEFIASRVAMLTRTADDINAVWLTEYPAYTFQEPRERLMIRAQLDAYIAKMYGLTHEELQYILDPKEVMGPKHPSETFESLKNKEIKLYGEYLTQRLVLTAYDAIMAGMLK